MHHNRCGDCCNSVSHRASELYMRPRLDVPTFIVKLLPRLVYHTSKIDHPYFALTLTDKSVLHLSYKISYQERIMKKNKTSTKKPTASLFSIKEQAAIDAMNSVYSYKEVSYFLDSIHKVLIHVDLTNLSKEEVTKFYFFTCIILTMLNSSQLTDIISKQSKGLISGKIPSTKERTGKDVHDRESYDQHLKWIVSFVEGYEFPIKTLLNEYYKYFPLNKF